MPLLSSVPLLSLPARFSRRRLPQAAALAGLTLLVLAAGTSAQAQTTFTVTATGYRSPNFVDNQGTFTFFNSGFTNAQDTFSTTPATFSLDGDGSSVNYDPNPKNSVPATIFTGTATSQLTITGLGTQAITQDYTLDGTAPYLTSPSFLAGPAVTFALPGGTQQLLLTPLASSGFFSRKFSGQIVPLAPAPVPEPSALASLGVGILGLAGLVVARRRKAVPGV